MREGLMDRETGFPSGWVGFQGREMGWGDGGTPGGSRKGERGQERGRCPDRGFTVNPRGGV